MAKLHGAVDLAQPLKVGLYLWISVLLKGKAENPGVRATAVAEEKLELAINISKKAI